MRLGPVGVGGLVTVIVDSVLTFADGRIEGSAVGGTSLIHLVLVAVIGTIAGFSGGWIAATIEEDALAAQVLGVMLGISGLATAGFVGMAGSSSYAIAWLIGGLLQAVGAFAAARVKFA